jgi:D-Tyr-tRNAtyr deacylase
MLKSFLIATVILGALALLAGYAAGRCGARMEVSLVNDGPVTIILDV